MTNRFIEQAKSQMGSIEKLITGLPGIRGYLDKELRRDVDFKLRQQIADTLSQPLQQLYAVQKKLLKGGGLAHLADCDNCITRLQTLIDRIKSASYGYAGLFDAVKVREEQLDALHRFDVALATVAGKIGVAVAALDGAAAAKEGVAALVSQLSSEISELTTLFNKRHEAVVSPDLLTEVGFAPTIEERLKDAVG